jgi:hypothetical protein
MRRSRLRAMLGFPARERCQDLSDQRARRLRAQFDRDAFVPAIRRIDEIDAERMVERRVIGVIEIDFAVSIRIQPLGPFALPVRAALRTM